MPRLWIFLLFLSQTLGASLPAWAQSEGSLQGRWRLLEHSCVNSAGQRQRLAPGYPGSKEEWVLTFRDQSLHGNFIYSSTYVGVMNQDCRLDYEGSFDVESAGTQVSEAKTTISSLRLTPQRRSLESTGNFPVPCQLFPTDRSQKFEARFERLTGRHSRSERLRLRGTNVLKRCQGKNDRTEFLFELF